MRFNIWLPIDGRNVEIPADDGCGTRLGCEACGHRFSKTRPLSKPKVRTAAANIADTLSEKNIEFDRTVLLHTIERRNTSHNQGKQDSHVFAPAVRAAIEAAAGGRDAAQQSLANE
jgi:hypothetical protein